MLKAIAKKMRKAFETQAIPSQELIDAYQAYHPTKNIKQIVQSSQKTFPHGTSKLTAAYLQKEIGTGTIVHGNYKGKQHAFLKVGKTIIDITADQYGGPAVYVGPLKAPWDLVTV